MSSKIVQMAVGVADAARVIREGGVVVFPTDTVYGLAVDPTNAAAVRRLFELKRRDASKPIPILLSDVSRLGDVCDSPPALASRLAAVFLPGPLTLIVPLSAALPSELSAGSGAIGVRVPAHDQARSFIRACGGMLAVTSANISDAPPVTSVGELSVELLGLVDLALDGGVAPGGVASTVLDVSVVPPVVLRAGPLSAADLDI